MAKTVGRLWIKLFVSTQVFSVSTGPPVYRRSAGCKGQSGSPEQHVHAMTSANQPRWDITLGSSYYFSGSGAGFFCAGSGISPKHCVVQWQACSRAGLIALLCLCEIVDYKYLQKYWHDKRQMYSNQLNFPWNWFSMEKYSISLKCIEVNNLSASFSFLKEKWLPRFSLFFILKSQLSEMSLHVNKGWFSPPFCVWLWFALRDSLIMCWECSSPWEYTLQALPVQAYVLSKAWGRRVVN